MKDEIRKYLTLADDADDRRRLLVHDRDPEPAVRAAPPRPSATMFGTSSGRLAS